jgi:adenosine deaminase
VTWSTPDAVDRVRALPKVELHVHLEGSLSPTTIGELAGRHGVDVSVVWPDGLPERLSFVDFDDFIRQYAFGVTLLRSGDDVAAAVEGLARDLAANHVRYAEVTTTACLYHHLCGMDPRDYRDGLDEGRRRARALGVELAWVVDIPRALEAPDEGWTAAFLAGPDVPDGVVGIGLGGPEVGFPAEWYEASFAAARALGLRSLPHAGETVGPESVVASLDVLRADRLGHGVRSVEDPELVRRLADTGVPLEVSPTSNLLLGVAPSMDAHPLRQLLDAGVRVSINTDDPGYFATDLTRELVLVAEHLDLSFAEVRDLELGALDASYASDATRARIRGEIDASPTS